MTVIMLIAGLVLLVAGAEGLVRGASRIALSAGISPLVVGLTVVAFGTSSPELAVSVSAVRGGASDIAIGNVVGSSVLLGSQPDAPLRTRAMAVRRAGMATSSGSPWCLWQWW